MTFRSKTTGVPSILLALIAVGLIYPAILTIRRAFYSGKFFDLNFGTPRTRGKFVGFDNFQALWTTPGLPAVFRNTLFWVIFVPLFATGLGLLAAIPAVIFYNKFNHETEQVIGGYEGFADEFSTIMSRQLDEE